MRKGKIVKRSSKIGTQIEDRCGKVNIRHNRVGLYTLDFEVLSAK